MLLSFDNFVDIQFYTEMLRLPKCGFYYLPGGSLGQRVYGRGFVGSFVCLFGEGGEVWGRE